MDNCREMEVQFMQCPLDYSAILALHAKNASVHQSSKPTVCTTTEEYTILQEQSVTVH